MSYVEDRQTDDPRNDKPLVKPDDLIERQTREILGGANGQGAWDKTDVVNASRKTAVHGKITTVNMTRANRGTGTGNGGK